MRAYREGVWAERDDAPFRRPEWRGVAFQSGQIAGATALVAFAAAPFGLALPAASACGLLGLFGLTGSRMEELATAERARALALREEFGTGPAWPVDLLVHQGATPTGRDQGLLWIEERRIAFSGFRTSFALAPEQTAAPVRHDAGVRGVRHRLVLRLARETPVGPLALSFWPVADGVRRAEDDAADLRYALNRALKGDAAGGQWPPLALGPGAPSPRALLLDAVLRLSAPHLRAWRDRRRLEG